MTFKIILACTIFLILRRFLRRRRNMLIRKLGTNNILQFKLSRNDVRSLNKIESHHFSDHFCSIRFCLDAVIQLYLDTCRTLTLQNQWKNDTETANLVFDFCKYIVAKKYRCKLASKNIPEFLEDRLAPAVQETIRALQPNIRQLDEQEERRLYNLYSSRWKTDMSVLSDALTTRNARWFYDEVCRLASLNNTRVTVYREIFYSAYINTVQKDKEISAKLYLHYIGVGSVSDTFKYKEVSRRNRKILFPKEEQEKEFDRICQKLLKNKKLEPALDAVKEMYVVRRRKIQIDTEGVLAAGADHAEVVELLNEYLAVEEPETIIVNKIPEQPTLVMQPETQTYRMNGNQEALLRLFADNAFRLGQKEIDTFARTNGALKNQLVESINEMYYEQLDDVLIEENDDHYILNQEYYQQIASQ